MSTSPLVIILLGPPGSGKGTQAKRLSQEFQLPHISTGDLFRENISQSTDLGKKANGYIQKGHLVPDELVMDMLFDRLKMSDCKNGYILDGFPRTTPQAESFESSLTSQDHLIALNLEVPDERIVQRAAGRLVCKQCGTIYNRFIAPLVLEGTCDQCGGEIYQRFDDKPEVVLERLKVYHNQTEPLIHYYIQKGVLKSFNADQSPEHVFAGLRSAVLKVKAKKIT